jgi:hypothetical protein
MRSLFLTAAILLTCSSFLNDGHDDVLSKNVCTKNIFNLTVRRLSGERVIIAWHTDGDSSGIVYEVLRRHSKREVFASLGVVSPELKQDSNADYSFVDTNNFTDSSYYCLKKTNADSVVFYSITKGVEGIGRER